MSDENTTEEQPIISEGQQKIGYNGLDIHFSNKTAEEACDLFLLLYERLTSKTKEAKYAG